MKPLELSYFKYTVQISSSKRPRVKQHLEKSQEKDLWSMINNKKHTASGKLLGSLLLQEERDALSHLAVGSTHCWMTCFCQSINEGK